MQAQVFPSIEEMSGDVQTSEYAISSASNSTVSSRPSSSPLLSEPEAFTTSGPSQSADTSSAAADQSAPALFSVSSSASVLLASAAVSSQAMVSEVSGLSDSANGSGSSSQTESNPAKQSRPLGVFVGAGTGTQRGS